MSPPVSSRASGRKALGYLSLVLFIAAYAVIAITLAEMLLPSAWGWQLLYYGIAGLVWIYPAIKILDLSHKADRRKS